MGSGRFVREVVKREKLSIGAGGPEKLKDPAKGGTWRSPTSRPPTLTVVLLVGKKVEKVLPAALKLTVIGLMTKRVAVTVAALVGSTR